MPSAEPPVLAPCPLHQSRFVIHPISRSGSECSTNFLRLVRQSALLKSASSSLALPVHLDGDVVPRDFFGRIVHASTNPNSVSVELSLLLLLLSADSGTVWCSLHLFRSPCSTGSSVTSGGESIAWVLFWKTLSRQIGVRVCLVAQFKFFSTAFDPRAWTLVVFWKENVGRQPQLITPENEGGDETSYPSPPKFFDDPDVPSGPSGPPEPPGPLAPPGQPGPPPGWPPDPSPAGDRERVGPRNASRDSQSAAYLERVMATTTVYPRSFGISITLTFRAGYLKKVIDTATVYSRWFEFLTTLTFRAPHGHLATLRESMEVYPHLFEISSR